MISRKPQFESPMVRLRILREVLDIKQSTFAKFLKIDPATLRKWERKSYSLTLPFRKRFVHVGIDPEWLEYENGDMLLCESSEVRDKILHCIKHKQ